MPTLSAHALSERLKQTELAYHMAVEMGQYKAGFLSRTSHELRSPLNSVMSLHQLILTGLCDSPEEERDFLEQSYAAAQTLLALLNEASNISKLEHGTIELFLEPLSLTDLLSELETLTHLHARNRNLRLKIELPERDVQVLGDRRWLRQVLMNLVTTSIHHMNQGTIRVFPQSLADQGMVQLWLEDERSPDYWHEAVDLLNPADEAALDSEIKESKAEVVAAIESP
ncbi:MAG: HAMP domain-containing sensor histidine kinase, partial [Elainellaceae cyanobacterium]